jgi:Ni/Fe-hydrogenase subunit HybB-like protein
MKYYPKFMEISLSIGVVAMLIVAYKFIVNRMAIMHDHPDYESGH